MVFSTMEVQLLTVVSGIEYIHVHVSLQGHIMKQVHHSRRM